MSGRGPRGGGRGPRAGAGGRGDRGGGQGPRGGGRDDRGGAQGPRFGGGGRDDRGGAQGPGPRFGGGARDDRGGAQGPRFGGGGRDDRGGAQGPGPRFGGGARDDRGGAQGPRFGGGARDDRGGGAGPRLGGPRDDRSRGGGDRDERFGGPHDERSRGADDTHSAAGRDDRHPRPPAFSGPGERSVYGVGPVREVIARRPQSIKALWVDPERAGKAANDPVVQLVTAARAAGVRVEDRDRDILDAAAGEGARHQGIIAWLGAFHYADIEDLVTAAQALGEPALLVALDGVEDPRNLGAILRSAYLLGAHGVIIPEHRAAEVTAVVAKASAGASELLPIAQVGNLVRALEQLRELGLWRVAVHAEMDAKPIAQIDGTMSLVLVLGAEGSGVRPLVAKNCDFHALIPMQQTAVGSFNVSVAAAIALYEIRRQRLARNP